MNRYRFTLGIVTSGLNRAELPSLEGEETILSLSLSLSLCVRWASLLS